MPQKMRHAALRSALSALARDGQLVFVDQLTIETAKTKAMVGVVKALAGDQTALILLAERNEPVERSVRNIPEARTLRAAYINVRDLLQYGRVIVPLAALSVIQSLLGKSAPVAE
jgi:large subunit ribosomal protein L4